MAGLAESARRAARLASTVGFDPLLDVDQVIFANGDGLYRLTKCTEQGKTIYGSEGSYFLLVKGRFNLVRLRN